jgi:formate dehydrogenase accessory protein FdhD
MDNKAASNSDKNSIDHPGASTRSVLVWSNKTTQPERDCIVEETPVALVYNGISHAVMMVSPLELEAFALGFSLTEGIVERPSDVYQIDTFEVENGVELRLTISNRRFMQLKALRRNLVGRSGCGICGVQSLDHIQKSLPTVTSEFCVSHSAIDTATSTLTTYQRLQVVTGGVHGAAWCDSEGNIVHLCEDVGRHNALDKLIGSLWAEPVQLKRAEVNKAQGYKGLSGNLLQKPGFLLISSRASYEIVQKAARASISVVVAVSAPTSLAIDIAQQTGTTLVGFARRDRHVVYSHGERLTGEITSNKGEDNCDGN